MNSNAVNVAMSLNTCILDVMMPTPHVRFAEKIRLKSYCLHSRLFSPRRTMVLVT